MSVRLNLGTSLVGRAVLCLPSLANERVLVCHDDTHGVTRPTCLKVAKNYDVYCG
jgi:hypothetical protein